tara:strand:- start:2838 stop:3197 length:360 start_codon:yes stop_codon:yes gene_type:complete
MERITVNFNSNTINSSVQIGDLAYFRTPTQVGGFLNTGDEPLLFGVIVDLDREGGWIIVEDENEDLQNPAPGDFIMFAKNSVVNISGLTGYFAQAKLVNNSVDRAELFNISTGISISSK